MYKKLDVSRDFGHEKIIKKVNKMELMFVLKNVKSAQSFLVYFITYKNPNFSSYITNVSIDFLQRMLEEYSVA